MELQLALDLVDIPEAKKLVKEVEQHIDIVEIGTPVVINEGLRAVKEIKEAFPNLKVLADLKVMDAAGYEVMKASEAGADIITILGAAEDMTIKGAMEEAKKQQKKILVDMIGVKDIEGRAKELDAFGVDYICVHTGYDLQAVGENSFEDLRTIKRVVKNAKVAVAGGIKLSTLPEVIKAQPDLVIVGGGITGEEDKKSGGCRNAKVDQTRLIPTMPTTQYYEQIIEELNRAARQLADEEAETLADRILQSRKVFVAGAGRSGLMVRAFAMRLMQMGMDAYVVGETVTPNMEKDDILIIGSGSGETKSLIPMAEKARSLADRSRQSRLTRIPPSPKFRISPSSCQAHLRSRRAILIKRYSLWGRYSSRRFYYSVMRLY